MQSWTFVTCHHMLTSSTQLQNMSFHVVERIRTSARCRKTKNTRARRAKRLFFFVKYVNLWRSCCRRSRGCLSSLIIWTHTYAHTKAATFSSNMFNFIGGQFSTNLCWYASAVARGGAGGARAPPVFFLESKTDMYKMLKIKYYQATVWEVFKKRPADEVYVCL